MIAWSNYRPEGRSVSVFEIEKDAEGLIWLGTSNGLYTFDGFSMRLTGDKGAPFNGHVHCMLIEDDNVWLGTNQGLYRFNRDRHRVEPVLTSTMPEIRAMLKVGDNMLLGTMDGLFIYNETEKSLREMKEGLTHKTIYSLFMDPTNDSSNVLIGTYDGLSRYDLLTDKISPVEIKTPGKSNANFFVNDIGRDPTHGCLLLATEGALLRYFPRSGIVSTVAGFEGNSVKALAVTPDNKIVAGTDDGMYILDDPGDGTNELRISRHDSRDSRSIVNNTVWSLLVNQSGTIMAGTDMGLSIADVNSPVRIIKLSDLTGIEDGQQIYSFLRDSEGWLWIGGTGGLIKVRQGDPTRWYRLGNKDSYLSHNRVRDIVQLSDGSICIATDGSLNVFDRQTEKFTLRRLATNDGRRNANWAYSILEDTANSTVWTGAYLGGIIVTDRNKMLATPAEEICRADTFINTTNGLANDFVNRMVGDDRGNRWVLLFRDSCLTRIDRAGKIHRYDVHSRESGAYPSLISEGADGKSIWTAVGNIIHKLDNDGNILGSVEFPVESADEVIIAIAPIDKDIWATTSSGEVWIVDAETMSLRLLSLPTMDYTAIYDDPATGLVLLGSIDKIVTVDRARIASAHTAPELHIARCYSNDELIELTDVIGIRGPQSNLAFELATYDYTPGTSSRFAYRLSDITSAWTLLPSGVNVLELNNLPEGTHTLEMMILDAPDSLKSFTIKVRAPWYRTPLAIIIYALFVGFIAIVVIVYFRRRQKRHIEKIERETTLRKVNERMEFFANISHDLKTPLSMILGPLSRLRDEKSASRAAMTKGIDVAYKNALKLNDLIHRTIEINHVEAQTDGMLIYSHIEVVEFCKTVFDSYADSYPGRHFVFTAHPDRIVAEVDAIKIESILNNLLSNAVKYSDEGGTISCTVNLSETGHTFIIKIADDGIGIPENERSLIFQRLYRSAKASSQSEGTGLGLYFVKRYVEMHKGLISVESSPGQGAAFIITLPLHEDEAATAERENEKGCDMIPQPSADDSRPRILIVDDNVAITDFLADLFADEYNCMTAANGKSGLATAYAFVPDLIIADEMMPLMTGLEMAAKIKEPGSALSTVPIILLTAKSGNDLESESVRVGVDVFMTKPFDAPLLKARVAQIIKARAEVKDAARIAHIATPRIVDALSDQERLIAAVTDAIESHISDPDLGVAMICELTGMQSKQLYRLVKKYVGLSPSDHIKQTRMRKAAILLRQDSFSVSEVMFMVGFSSPSYFAKCFMAMYGCKPIQYKESLPNSSNV